MREEKMREGVWDYFVVDKDRVSLFTEEGAMPFEVIGVSELLEIAGYKKKGKR